MWQKILQPADIEIKISEIEHAISASRKNIKNGGLLNGLAGLSIFYAIYGKSKGKPQYQELAEQILTEALEQVTTKWHAPTFCSGFPGVLWAADYLEKSGLITEGFDSSSADEYAKHLMMGMIQEGNIDFFHGSLGIFYYLVSKDEINEKAIDEYLDALTSRKIQYEDGSAIWESLIINGATKVVGKNFSLSHGVSSMIVILSKLYKKLGDPRVSDIIRSLLKFIEKYRKEGAEDLSLYPAYLVDDGRPVTYQTRLGWCYGDLCVGLAYLNAGICLDEKEYIKTSSEIFHHAALRTDLEKNHIKDAGICHGSAGIGHIFNRAYNYFRDETFRQVSLYWFNETLKFGRNSNVEAAGFLNYTVDGWTNEICLLEGISGIGTALLSATSDTEPTWDTVFLIS